MMVAAGHLSFLPFGLSPGVIAVTCFYEISGYAMNVLVENSFGPAAGGRRPNDSPLSRPAVPFSPSVLLLVGNRRRAHGAGLAGHRAGNRSENRPAF